jgi:uncharacterized protein (DUF2345 family)
VAYFRVSYRDGSVARNTKVTISVDGGGIARGITDARGYVSIPTTNSRGKIVVKGKTVYHGTLSISEVYI